MPSGEAWSRAAAAFSLSDEVAINSTRLGENRGPGARRPEAETLHLACQICGCASKSKLGGIGSIRVSGEPAGFSDSLCRSFVAINCCEDEL